MQVDEIVAESVRGLRGDVSAGGRERESGGRKGMDRGRRCNRNI